VYTVPPLPVRYTLHPHGVPHRVGARVRACNRKPRSFGASRSRPHHRGGQLGCRRDDRSPGNRRSIPLLGLASPASDSDPTVSTEHPQRLVGVARTPGAPLRYWLFTPELQWQSRGTLAYLTGVRGVPLSEARERQRQPQQAADGAPPHPCGIRHLPLDCHWNPGANRQCGRGVNGERLLALSPCRRLCR
jgi:hypothetical protein